MHGRGQRHGVPARPEAADYPQGPQVPERAPEARSHEPRRPAAGQGDGPRPQPHDEAAGEAARRRRDCGERQVERKREVHRKRRHRRERPHDHERGHPPVDGPGGPHVRELRREGGRLQLRHGPLRGRLAEDTLQRGGQMLHVLRGEGHPRGATKHLPAAPRLPGGAPRADQGLLGPHRGGATILQQGDAVAEGSSGRERLQQVDCGTMRQSRV
mmetsp:Transcript_13575/g.40459  ORF Transcript_13575/g.40459 Transcript_13575/m.40459 type:complete len:214 (+) Transcript_13575:867-1508(+)